MARCIYKIDAKKKDPKSTYKHACDWGSHQPLPPPPYVLMDGVTTHMEFIYLDPGECKGCPCKKVAKDEK